ncbi:hypothetical protein Tco_0681353 [Tanacetum coccineum]|uniref:CASP-like protein n=1 Tax=Tanacetum coccineum TaxID=301880 RepID=A0ABQ4XN49_9ASTR
MYLVVAAANLTVFSGGPLVKINYDAVFKDSTAAIAIVGRDSSGFHLSCIQVAFVMLFSPLHAVIFAIHRDTVPTHGALMLFVADFVAG